MLNTNANRGGLALARAVKELYGEGQTDYHLEPIVLVDEHGQPVGRISDGDAVIFCCRRGEREIELTEAFTEADFTHFPRHPLRDLDFVILTLYHEKFAHLPIAFAPSMIQATLGEVVSQAGLRQFRAAESEKFAHVTFFLNGGNNQAFPGETDVRIPSPKGIPFDQVPELSLPEVTRQVLGGIEQEYDLIVTNFANGDVIGHTSSREAKICCAEHVDVHLGQLVQAALARDYVVFVTADHGNLEELWNPNGSPHVAHTNNLVELILLDGRPHQPAQLRNGILADIAPTILSALGCDPSASMTGSSLVTGGDWGGKRHVLLVILDGWGIGRMDASNPIYLGHTPVWNDLLRRYPSCRLEASGEAVGLQADKPGNSEAGHMNIGAGRVVQQDDVRLDLSLQDGSFYRNETFCRVIEQTRQRGASLHLLALLTEKSSHGSIDYPLAILKMAKECGLEKVYLHMIFDGRSTAPGSAPALLEMLEAKMNAIGLGQMVTGVGRGLALDRDGNYGKIQRVYNALVAGEGRRAPLFSHSQIYRARCASSGACMNHDLYTRLIAPAKTKIVLLVMDGLGGLPETPDGKTELETACTPNLDRLAAFSKLGLSQPAGPGVTVGSGPGHLALFGYDPIQYEIGRGALEALGVDFELGPDDLAARGNFCTVDCSGCITDRRAGRLPTERSRVLAERLRTIQIPGATFFVEPVKEHRFAFIVRAPGLGDALTETDPLKTGVPTLPVRALNPESAEAARLVNQFLDQAHCLLANEQPANMITLRGFNKMPVVPSFAERYGLRAASIAVNGMYRGVSKLAGMNVVPLCGETIEDEFATLEKYWPDYDFFYMHFKKTDTCGESGDFLGKARVIEEIDAQIPRLLALNPDVVVVGGDHSSPAVLRSHSWHPVPTLLYSRWVLPDGIAAFGERACARGSLGVFPATQIMPLALANAQRIEKYGA